MNFEAEMKLVKSGGIIFEQTMQELRSLNKSLESSDASIRDKAALRLMDIKDESSVAPLLRAISNPENVNHRGTLVYALGAFNCEDVLEVMVDLALTGDFEVSVGAVSIIEGSARSEESIQRVKEKMLEFNSNLLVADYHKIAFQYLLNITGVVQ